MCLLRSRRRHFGVSYLHSVALLRATFLTLVSRYYDLCQATDPTYLPAAIKIPWNYYSQCAATLAGADCNALGFELPAANVSLLYSTLLPTGTATLSNNEGMLTTPPYGSTTEWYFYGSTGPATIATAAAHKAGSQGAQGAQGTQVSQRSQGSQPSQGDAGTGSTTGAGSPSATSSGARSEGAKIKGVAALLLVTLSVHLV